MILNNNHKALVTELTPMLEKSSRSFYIWIAILTGFVTLGFVAFVIQMVQGQIVTGMRDNVVWGIYEVNFILFVGVSYSGAFISGILHFIQSRRKNSVSRIIEIITVLCLCIGPIFILLCIGRLDRLHYLFLYPRIQSPITWDILAIMTDLVGCFIYLYLTFIPDFAILRDSDHLKIPAWKKKLYKTLAIGYHHTPSQKKRLHKITKTMSAMVIALAIVAYTVLAWIFSLTLQPGWNSTIFAPYFIIGGIYTGVAVIILVMYVVRRTLNLEKYIDKSHFTIAGLVLLVFSLVYGYFTFSEYFARWFSHKTIDEKLLNTLFTRYFWTFIIANYIGILVPIAILFFKKLRTIRNITIAALIVLIGSWLNRYLIIIPTLETPYIPIQDTRIDYVFYSATWIEWALVISGFAAFMLFFSLLLKIVPIIPLSGIIESENESTTITNDQ
ncbi:MAG: hypothetical protein COB98_08090 [Flavobacteriaceae bacterium]|nr:MAG: hypothetical protein COB98_08090 [Flavobacteriaceae bacterium]